MGHVARFAEHDEPTDKQASDEEVYPSEEVDETPL
jgi:hypothetical protein